MQNGMSMKSNTNELKRYKQKKYCLAKTINQFILIKSFEEQVKTEENIKWLDAAAGIHDIELTKKIIKELRSDSYYSDIYIKRMEEELGINK